MSTIFYGGLISPSSLTSYLALPRAVLSVSRSTGVIEWIEEDVPASELQQVLAKHGYSSLEDYNNDMDLVGLKLGEFLMPGFVDTHTVRAYPSLHWFSGPEILMRTHWCSACATVS